MTQQLTTEPGYRLEYIVSHEAYYRSVVRERSVTVGKNATEGGCAWEFDVVEHPNIGIKVGIFDDAFQAFAEVAPLFAALAERQPRDLREVRSLLDELGLVDATQRNDPQPAPNACACACGCPMAACGTEHAEPRTAAGHPAHTPGDSQ